MDFESENQLFLILFNPAPVAKNFDQLIIIEPYCNFLEIKKNYKKFGMNNMQMVKNDLNRK